MLAGLLWSATAPLGAQPADIEAEADAPVAVVEDADRPPTADPASSADVAATRLLEARLRQFEGLVDVTVSVHAGVATLDGTALSFQEAERAREIAEATEGVVAVRDHLQIETGVGKRVRPAVERSFELLRDAVAYVPLLLIALLVIGLFSFLGRVLSRWDGLFSRLSPNSFLQDLVRQVVRVATLLVGVLIALELLDATALVGAVLGAAGVFGLAVGFAFRDLVENYIASVLLSVRQPFAPNDHVRIDDHEGKVVRLTSRATILMTLDGNHLRIPNSVVFKSVILNTTRNPKRRFHFDVGVGVGEDLLEAQRLGVRQLEEQAGVLGDPAPDAVITQLGDSNVVIRFFGWVDQSEASFAKVRAEAIRRVKLTLEGAGMDLPEPIYRVVLQSTETPSAPAARPRSRQTDLGDLSAEALEAGEDIDAQIAEERASDTGPRDLLDPAAPRE